MRTTLRSHSAWTAMRRLTRILFSFWWAHSGPRRARRACEGAARGVGVPASDRAGVWGGAPRWLVRRSTALAVAAFVITQSLVALAQIKGQVRPAATPAWNKGILPISRESYYNAIECGKQGGENPPCVFYDTGLCQNEDFALALYTPYKMVAYEVWNAVRRKQPPPMPSYQEAQRTRITVGVTSAGSKNPLTDLGTQARGPGSRAGRPVDQRHWRAVHVRLSRVRGDRWHHARLCRQGENRFLRD